jgi:hypothetical protein
LRRSRSPDAPLDDDAADPVVSDREVPPQVGDAAGEVARYPAVDYGAAGLTVGDREDLAGVREPRCRTGLPRSDLVGPMSCPALVDDGCVFAEEVDDRVDKSIGVVLEVAADDVGGGAHAVLLGSCRIAEQASGRRLRESQGADVGLTLQLPEG